MTDPAWHQHVVHMTVDFGVLFFSAWFISVVFLVRSKTADGAAAWFVLSFIAGLWAMCMPMALMTHENELLVASLWIVPACAAMIAPLWVVWRKQEREADRREAARAAEAEQVLRRLGV